MPAPDKLEDQIVKKSNVKTRLREFSGWKFDGRELKKTFELATFPAAIKMVNRVAKIAQKLDHHPDFLINFKKLTLTCSTHKHDAITEADFELVRQIEAAQ